MVGCGPGNQRTTTCTLPPLSFCTSAPNVAAFPSFHTITHTSSLVNHSRLCNRVLRLRRMRIFGIGRSNCLLRCIGKPTVKLTVLACSRRFGRGGGWWVGVRWSCRAGCRVEIRLFIFPNV